MLLRAEELQTFSEQIFFLAPHSPLRYPRPFALTEGFFLESLEHRIHPKILSDDRQQAWFDYLALTFTERSSKFAEAYIEVYKRYYARRINAASINKIKPLSIKKDGWIETLPQKQLNFLWKARQCADYLEVPYYIYCDLGIRHADYSCWKYLPRIDFMASEKMQMIVYEQWLEYRKYHLILPESPSDTQEYHSYLTELAEHRRHPKFLIKHLLDKALLTVDKASELFGPTLTEQALTV